MNKYMSKRVLHLKAPSFLAQTAHRLSPWPPVIMFCLKLCPQTELMTHLELASAAATYTQGHNSFQ